MRVPAVPIAVAVPAGVWDEFLTTAPESRTKALLREGEVSVPVIDAATVEQTLSEAGAVGSAVAAVAANGADAALARIGRRRGSSHRRPADEPDRKTTAPAAPPNASCFEFLESLPETAGRFELNAALDFRFGPRLAEVDLLCRSPRIAIELDGYFHFLDTGRLPPRSDQGLGAAATGLCRIAIPGRRRDPAVGDDPRPHSGRTSLSPNLEQPLTTTLATQPDTAVADLVLVRMTLPSKKPVAPSVVRKDVGKLLDSGLSAAEFDDLRNELASAGFLTKGKRNTFALTDAGRERALQFLGVAELPPRTNWSTVIAKYLFPKAAGLSANAAAKLDNGDKLAAFVLKRKYGLAAGAGSTVNQVLEAVAASSSASPTRRRSTACCVRS